MELSQQSRSLCWSHLLCRSRTEGPIGSQSVGAAASRSASWQERRTPAALCSYRAARAGWQTPATAGLGKSVCSLPPARLYPDGAGYREPSSGDARSPAGARPSSQTVLGPPSGPAAPSPAAARPAEPRSELAAEARGPAASSRAPPRPGRRRALPPALRGGTRPVPGEGLVLRGSPSRPPARGQQPSGAPAWADFGGRQGRSGAGLARPVRCPGPGGGPRNDVPRSAAPSRPPQKRPCAGPVIANHQSPLITADEAGGGGAFPGAGCAGGSGEPCPGGAGAEGGTRP